MHGFEPGTWIHEKKIYRWAMSKLSDAIQSSSEVEQIGSRIIEKAIRMGKFLPVHS